MFQTTNQSWLCHSYSMGFCWDLIFLCIWWRSYGDCTTCNGRGWFIHLGFVVFLLFFWLMLLNPTIGMSTIDLMVGYMLIKSSKAATYLSRDPALYIYPIYLQRYNRYNMI
jgi:hypothetical protein